MANWLTWNFLTDTGVQEQVATPVWGYKSILPDTNTKIKEVSVQPEAPQEQTMRTKEKFFQDMVTVQDREWVNEEKALELVTNYYQQKGYSVEWLDLAFEEDVIKEEIEPEVPMVEEPKEIPWLDIWVKTWRAISKAWETFKFESEVDDSVVESWLKRH